MAKRLVLRAQAKADVEQAVDFYLEQAGEAVALRFIDALERSYGSISRYPSAGSTRYAHELGFPGLRTKIVARYPFVVFYMEHSGHVEVLTVLHSQRDIPTWLLGSGDR